MSFLTPEFKAEIVAKLSQTFKSSYIRWATFLLGRYTERMEFPQHRYVGADYGNHNVFQDMYARRMFTRTQASWKEKATYTINYDAIDTNSLEDAEAAVKAWEPKMEGKLGLIEVTSMSIDAQGRISIMGKRDGRLVHLVQEIVHKVSSKGRPFVQWPARLYVDGKFYPADRYQHLFRKA